MVYSYLANDIYKKLCVKRYNAKGDVMLYNYNMKDEVALTTTVITDEQVANYAKELLKGDTQPVQAFENVFGFVPGKAQILEIEKHPLYRETLDSTTKFLQAQLIVNSVSLASETMRYVAQNAMTTQKQIDKLLQADELDLRKYNSMARLQLDTLKLVRDEQLKAAKILAGEDEDDDILIWEEVRNGR